MGAMAAMAGGRELVAHAAKALEDMKREINRMGRERGSR